MSKQSKPEKRSVVVESGWVFIGMWHPPEDGRPALLTEASNVRVWGTKAGLGELALNGPTKATVLDPCGVVVFDNIAAIRFSHPCTFG